MSAWEAMTVDEQSDHLRQLLKCGRGRGPLGAVYYIACPATMRLKIGFTTGKPEARLRALQTGSASELRLIAVRPGTMDDEAFLHAHFSNQRAHGEWFNICEELFEHICSVVWCAGSMHKDNLAAAPAWLRVGLRMLEDHYGELPDYLVQDA